MAELKRRWLAMHTEEYPSPLTSCPGYRAPSGLPLIVQMGDGSKVPEVLGSVIMTEAGTLEGCVFTEATYRNPVASAQELGRSILGARDAVVLIPKLPLRSAVDYRVVIEIAGERRVDWRFGVGSSADQADRQ